MSGALTFRLEAGVCEIRRFCFCLPNFQLRFLGIVSGCETEFMYRPPYLEVLLLLLLSFCAGAHDWFFNRCRDAFAKVCAKD